MEEHWFDGELSGCRLGDGRLDRRLRQLDERMDAGLGETIPLACQDWASTKAAYRFFSNSGERRRDSSGPFRCDAATLLPVESGQIN